MNVSRKGVVFGIVILLGLMCVDGSSYCFKKKLRDYPNNIFSGYDNHYAQIIASRIIERCIKFRLSIDNRFLREPLILAFVVDENLGKEVYNSFIRKISSAFSTQPSYRIYQFSDLDQAFDPYAQESIPRILQQCPYSTIAIDSAKEALSQSTECFNFLQDPTNIIPNEYEHIDGEQSIYILIFNIPHPVEGVKDEDSEMKKDTLEQLKKIKEHQHNDNFRVELDFRASFSNHLLNLTKGWKGFVNRLTVVPFVPLDDADKRNIIQDFFHPKYNIKDDTINSVLKKYPEVDDLINSLHDAQLQLSSISTGTRKREVIFDSEKGEFKIK